MITKKLRNAALSALLATGFAASAHAGVLEFQGVTFTTSFVDNVLTLEIDAAHPTGDWAGATTLGALALKDIGSFDSVSLSAAPGAAGGWTMSSLELDANGCTGGAHVGTGVCYSGSHVALADDMIFKFTFNGGNQDLGSPVLKLQMFNGEGAQKVGSLLSMEIAPVPEPETYGMLLAGLGLVGVAARRSRKRA